MTDITVENSGIRLAMSVIGPPSGIPLLFLHGFTMSRDTWSETIARVGGNYRAWTLDFRGHGHSDHASSYLFWDYVSDARAALAAIGAPTVLVGHSLGGAVAGALIQEPDTSVRGAFLEDPPWYFGERPEFERSLFPKLFEVLRTTQGRLQSSGAHLRAYYDFAANAPSLAGGKTADHVGERQLLSHASALQRQDHACWGPVDTLMATLDPGRPIQRPCVLIQADPTLGPAFLDGHEARLARSSPSVRIVRYAGSGHVPHRAVAFEKRFAEDLRAFLEALP